MATLCKVHTRLIVEEGFLKPGKSTWHGWKIDNTNVWWFHVVPSPKNYYWPRTIQIDKTKVTTPSNGVCNAYVLVTNPDPPVPNWSWSAPDGCYYRLYVAVATP